jgi:hypothetical protein
MNKTVKTIGWICLALGVLGILADAGAAFAARQFRTERLAAIEEINESIQNNERPTISELCIAKDADGDGKPDGDCIQRPDVAQGLFPRQGGQPRRGLMQMPRAGFDRRDGVGFSGSPIFLFALGPILAVIGAVMLLVNREPKEKAEVVEEAKSPKSKPAK